MVNTGREETVVLEQVARRYDPSAPEKSFDYWFVRLAFEAIRRFLTGPDVLEMGCGTGLMTSLLAELVPRLVVVEGAQRNIEAARGRLPVESRPRVRFCQALWEDFRPDRAFHDIILAGALEHVADPVAVLRNARGWLAPGGRVHVVVPNARSLHRRVGLAMGLLESLDGFSDNDRLLHHRRVYDKDLLLAHLRSTGLQVIHWQGILLKPLANHQMQGWPETLVRALYQVGLELPEYCGELYACATAG